MITYLVETMWLTRYHRPMVITYEQRLEFIGNKFRKFLIEEEYGITAKPSTSVNPTYNAILEQIHQVLINLVWTYNIKNTYVDKENSWLVILPAAAFEINSTPNILKGYSMGQLLFG